jgi:hypothetical protein
MIQFRYAKTEKGDTVDIKSLPQKDGSYYCIGCGKEMIPYLGEIKEYHFQHKANYSCSGETYLHNLAKTEFLKVLNNCRETKEPFYIEFSQNQTCHHYKKFFDISCMQEVSRKIDLLKYYTEPPVLEEREGEFIPDIKLFNKDKSKLLFIEIKVSHKSTYEKIASKYHIIEVSINTENDLECIWNKHIVEKSGKIKFYNFERVATINCKGDCKNSYYFLHLYNSGKVALEEKNLRQIKEAIKKENILNYQIAEINDFETFLIYINFIGECLKKGYLIKNCFLCKYVETNRFQRTPDRYNWEIYGKKGLWIHCSIYSPISSDKKQKPCNYAVICPDFELDNEQVRLLCE